MRRLLQNRKIITQDLAAYRSYSGQRIASVASQARKNVYRDAQPALQSSCPGTWA